MKKRSSGRASKAKRKVTPAKRPRPKGGATATAGSAATGDILADEQYPRAPKIKLKGKVFDRVPFKPDNPEWLCIDCEASEGQIHDLGCDTETCPRCGRQLIGCGCLPIPD